MEKKIICHDCKDLGIVYNPMKRSESKVCMACLLSGRLDQSDKAHELNTREKNT